MRFLTDPYRREVITRYHLSTDKTCADVTIAFVSDLHASTRFMPRARIERIVRETQELAADLVVLGGDFSAENNAFQTPLALRDTVEALAGLSAPLGVFATLGNHDWWDDKATQSGQKALPEIAEHLSHAGIILLSNQSRRLRADLWLAGIDSQHAFWRPKSRHVGADDICAATVDLPGDAASILLAHEPDIFPHIPPHIDLMLSGHTHGGQVKFLGRTPVVPSAYRSRFVYGHMRERGPNLVVSAGLGCSRVPLRFGVMPEIVHITLSSTKT